MKKVKPLWFSVVKVILSVVSIKKTGGYSVLFFVLSVTLMNLYPFLIYHSHFIYTAITRFVTPLTDSEVVNCPI